MPPMPVAQEASVAPPPPPPLRQGCLRVCSQGRRF
jgi:hypothetical protein